MTVMRDAIQAVSRRFASADGDVFEAFRQLDTGIDFAELIEWYQATPDGQEVDAGRTFGAALAVAMVAIEAERMRARGR